MDDVRNGTAYIYFSEGLSTLVAKVLILGEMISGKSVLSLFLINRHVYHGKKVVFLDLDGGQSDLGPPGMLAYAYVKESVPIFRNLTYNENTKTR